MNRNSYRILLFLISTILFIILCSIPFKETYTGEQISFFKEMVEPNPYYKFNPVYALPFLVPVIVFACSFFWKAPFKWWQRAFFSLLSIGVALAFSFILFANGWNTGNKSLPYHDISLLISFLFFIWPLLLAIPFPQNWKWLTWPFDQSEKDS
jgi:hypothetical protein